MGKQKLEKVDIIEDHLKRGIAYSKRKRGVIKKAMELSKLCNQEIFMLIFDRDKQRIVQYSSTPSFNAEICMGLTSIESI